MTTASHPPTATNPYLAGNFAPILEETTAFDLRISGSLPAELDGRLLRIGPNPPGLADPERHHWFIGSGMTHGVRLRDGSAEWYRSRYVIDDEVVRALGRAPLSGPHHGMGGGGANTNVIGIGGRTFAIVEAGSLPVELTDELECIARNDFDGTLPGSFTAHPKVDPDTGDLHAVVYYWEWDYVQYVVVGADARVKHAANIAVPGKPMTHDCAISASQVVVFDLPCTFDLEMAMSGPTLPYRWTPDYGARVGLIPKFGSADEVRWCELDEPCYVYHPMNAVDQADGTVVMEAVVHPSTFADDLRGPNEGGTTFERWTIDPKAGRVRRAVLDDTSQEFPRHHEGLIGKPYRYGYAAQFDSIGPNESLRLGSLLKHDLANGTTERHEVGAGRASNEAVFVPRLGAETEDDGWVLAYVYDGATDTSDIIVVDAQDFTGEPVARVHLPVRVPFGFHGNWVPTARV